MANYISTSEFKARQGITVTTNDTTIGLIVTEASRMIDGLCHRRFDPDGAATARVFHALTPTLVYIDDALEITAVATDEANDGNYATSWAASDWQAEPLNGVGLNRQTGWPYTRLVAIESRTFPLNRRASVQVTAKWGWAAVPEAIEAATYLVANRLFEERNAPFGSVGNAEFGSLPLRDQRTVQKLINPYLRRVPEVA